MDLTQLCNLTDKSVRNCSHNYEIQLSNIITENGIINILKLFNFCEFLTVCSYISYMLGIHVEFVSLLSKQYSNFLYYVSSDDRNTPRYVVRHSLSLIIS
jgi:hypothetical protein